VRWYPREEEGNLEFAGYQGCSGYDGCGVAVIVSRELEDSESPERLGCIVLECTIVSNKSNCQSNTRLRSLNA
jgi:hypothetical protein